MDRIFSSIDDDLKPHLTILAHYELLVKILQCEKAGIEKEQILKLLEPAKLIYNQSPFLKRCHDWPQGYAGDFETIEYLCKIENKAAKNSLPYYLEQIALNSTIAQQHRNKVRYQADIILETTLTIPNEAKILSIASGGNLDIRSIAKYIENKSVQFVLNDMDIYAIEFSKQHLNKLADKCDYVHGNIIIKINHLEKMGKFDLVIAGGLFDYLTDKQIIFILKNTVDKLLKINGTKKAIKCQSIFLVSCLRVFCRRIKKVILLV